MNKDTLRNCKRCNSDACYEQVLESGDKTYLCFGCGFSTSTLCKVGSRIEANLRATLPELYKELMFVDEDKMVWYPANVTVPELGMVFLYGTAVDNWCWKAVKATPILEEEKNRFPEGQTHKMDVKAGSEFAQNDFMTALEHIDFYRYVFEGEAPA